MNKMFVYLVGAGPGDHNLITKAGLEAIEKCEVLIYDRLISPKLLEFANKNCEMVYVGKNVGNHAIKQEEINQIIVNKALENKLVVRLKGGDPFVFGRGGEEILELEKNKIPYKVIPGVTSAISGLAYAGIPITHRGKSRGFHVITGHSQNEESSIPDNLDLLAKLNETLVFLMGFGNLKAIVDGLMENGKDATTPVAIISNATTDKQQEVRGNLENIVEIVSKTNIKAPALIVVGDVAELDFRDKNNKLSGLRVGITGTSNFVERQRNVLSELGASVLEVCTFDAVEIENIEFENSLNSLDKYSWLVFTSANAVRFTFKKIKELDIDLRALGDIKFAVVGKGTDKILREYGFKADFVPSEYSSKCLGNEILGSLSKSDRLLIPRPESHTNDLADILSENGFDFDERIIYTIKKVNTTDSDLEDLDFITFSSAKEVRDFFEGFDKKINCKVVCIGDLTKEELENHGIMAVKTESSDVDGLVKKICELRG